MLTLTSHEHPRPCLLASLVADLPVPLLLDWVFLRGAFAASQGLHALYKKFGDNDIYQASSFLIETEVKQTLGAGRGVYAKQDIGERVCVCVYVSD